MGLSWQGGVVGAARGLVHDHADGVERSIRQPDREVGAPVAGDGGIGVVDEQQVRFRQVAPQ